MKSLHTVTPYIYASAWFGNFLLTVLAVFLALRSPGPLSPVLFGTIAGSILLGNALPLGAYLIHFWWRQAEIRGEEREASETIRGALVQARQVEERLEEIQAAAAKAILVGRQLPDRLEKKAEAWEALIAQFDGEGVRQLAGLMEKLSASVESQIKEETDRSEGLQTLLDKLNHTVDCLKREPVDPGPVQAQLAALREEIQNLVAARPERAAAAGESGRGAALPEGDSVEDEEIEEWAEDPEAWPEVDSTEETSDDEGEKENQSQPELLPMQANPGVILEAGKCRLLVRAMVGVANRLYLRGDPPLLSWEEGKPLDLIGIGEYRWEAENVKEPIHCKLILNDETWAEGEDIVLTPGEEVRVRPQWS